MTITLNAKSLSACGTGYIALMTNPCLFEEQAAIEDFLIEERISSFISCGSKPDSRQYKKCEI